jgi:hypothetical protein
MTKKTTLALLLALSAGQATAAGKTLHEELTVNRGMIEESPGFYVKRDGSASSYVATTASARLQLAIIAEQRAASLAAALKRPATAIEKKMIAELNDLAANAREVALEKGPGSCSTGAAVAAYASAWGGTEASASAGVTLDFGPVTPTYNEATAMTSSSIPITNVGIGSNWAHASTFDWQGCYSMAEAMVICPTGGDGAYAFAESYGQNPNGSFCLQP